MRALRPAGKLPSSLATVARTASAVSSALAPGLWMICKATAGSPSSRLRSA
ncbi:Uncharacterised protein [Acinetobacter baumannii]|nr:Uncharacterised protein [Acinetobacter baumannii]